MLEDLAGLEDLFAGRSSWGVLLARSSWGFAATGGKVELLIILICVLFLLAGLYLVAAVQNYIGGAVAVILAIVIAVFFLA
jgi:hypothetical protein